MDILLKCSMFYLINVINQYFKTYWEQSVFKFIWFCQVYEIITSKVKGLQKQVKNGNIWWGPNAGQFQEWVNLIRYYRINLNYWKIFFN